MRGRRALYAIGWSLLAIALVPAVAAWAPLQGWRYDPSDLLYRIAVVVLLGAAALSLVAALRRAQFRYLPGVAAAVVVSLPAMATGPWPADRFDNLVCGTRSGCFFLTVRSVPTDTVFDIWKAPLSTSWRAERLEADGLSYSEDGSHLAEPRLRLSGNEKILVLARGGYLVDAIEIGSGRLLSDLVTWNDPARDTRMRENSRRIQKILDANA